jgi:hypothetical protein
MRRLDRRIATIAEAHPLPYAAAVGLAAGVLTLLVGWLARREWIWFLFIVPTVGAGATTYTRARRDRQDRQRLQQRPK